VVAASSGQRSIQANATGPQRAPRTNAAQIASRPRSLRRAKPGQPTFSKSPTMIMVDRKKEQWPASLCRRRFCAPHAAAKGEYRLRAAIVLAYESGLIRPGEREANRLCRLLILL
jgi:hypothetical protein